MFSLYEVSILLFAVIVMALLALYVCDVYKAPVFSACGKIVDAGHMPAMLHDAISLSSDPPGVIQLPISVEDTPDIPFVEVEFSLNGKLRKRLFRVDNASSYKIGHYFSVEYSCGNFSSRERVVDKRIIF